MDIPEPNHPPARETFPRGELHALWLCARFPSLGFQALAARNPSLLDALSRMLLWRVPLALAEGALGCWSLGRLYATISDPTSPLWQAVAKGLPPDMQWEDIRAWIQELPPPPDLSRILPWVALLAPLYVLSLWLHDAFWDHGCLWLLRGVQRTQGFRKTMVAEAESLTVGSLGTLLALLVYLPKIGVFLALPVGILGAYFWVLRGFALAAFHGCPTWKGVLATVLHVLLLGLGSLLLLLLCMVVMFLAAA